MFLKYESTKGPKYQVQVKLKYYMFIFSFALNKTL